MGVEADGSCGALAPQLCFHSPFISVLASQCIQIYQILPSSYFWPKFVPSSHFSSICISFIGFYSIACNSSLFVVASIGFTRLDRLNRVLSMSWFSK